MSKPTIYRIRLTEDSAMHKAYEPFGLPLDHAPPSINYEVETADGWQPVKAGEMPGSAPVNFAEPEKTSPKQAASPKKGAD